MAFKIRSIDVSAAVITGGAFAVVAILTALMYLLPLPMWIYPLVVAVAVYLIAHYTIRKFVIYRLKPIYQTVLSRTVKTSELETELLNDKKMIGKVENQVTEWKQNNSTEIKRLKENERYRKEFIGNLSHEIKTPIFNIQGYILTLLDGGLSDPTINVKYLERAEKSIDRLINIVHDLEEISKLESGVWNLQREKFNIADMARDIAEENEMEAAKRGISIIIGDEKDSTDKYIFVNADKHYIEQVLTNLVVNSIKYGHDNGTTNIRFIDLFDRVMVEVEDNGVGIEKENLPRVFERFYRTDKSRSREQGGTGLGLAIVKHILEAHGESVTIRSEIDKGSTFSFTLSKN